MESSRESAIGSDKIGTSAETTKKEKSPKTSTSESSSSSIIASNKNYGIRLLRFFIYNPSFGPKEGQEAQKILFFYDPDDKDSVNIKENHDRLEQQIKHV